MTSPVAVVVGTVDLADNEFGAEEVGVEVPETIPGSALRLLIIVGNWRGFAEDLEVFDGGNVNTPCT